MKTHSRPIARASFVAVGLMLAACASSAKGSSRPAEATSASSTVNEGQLENSQSSRMEDLLARVPGLEVVRVANGGYALRIRGGRGVGGDYGEPMLVVDGMPVRTGGNEQVLSALNPKDVARIEVLKDAGSTAIYGSGAANGVVVITTRRGKNP